MREEAFMAAPIRHFTDLSLTETDDLRAMLDDAIARKQRLKANGTGERPLEGKVLAMIFDKPSTRTRVSFEAGIVELGGHPMVLRAGELQLTRGESLRDTAYVLSRHVAAIGVRTGD
jgi:ornithine carbamoyltransferase